MTRIYRCRGCGHRYGEFSDMPDRLVHCIVVTDDSKTLPVQLTMDDWKHINSGQGTGTSEYLEDGRQVIDYWTVLYEEEETPSGTTPGGMVRHVLLRCRHLSLVLLVNEVG